MRFARTFVLAFLSLAFTVFSPSARHGGQTASMARLRHVQQLADPPLAHQKMRVQPAHFRFALYELHPFFSITVFNISLSRLKSATSFFSRPFSSTSRRDRCVSPTVIPPYFAFHA